MRRLALAALLALAAGCAPLPPPHVPPVIPPQPAPTLAFDLVACRTPFVDNYCDGPAGATFTVHTGTHPDTYATFHGDGNGYAWATGIPDVPDSDLAITAPDFEPVSVHISPPVLAATNAKGLHNAWELAPAHIDPSTIPLETLAKIRGAMWPTGLGLPFGPRPGQPTNIIATDFLHNYSAADQARILAWEKAQGYTHVVVGPLVDSDGYHGQYTPTDWRAHWDEFLDVLQQFWDAGLAPVVFLHPDGWSLEQTKTLTPLLLQPRAQRLIRIVVPGGWEPTRYGWSSCTWAGYGQWARETLPQALVLLHTVADVDGPVGTDALCDDNGHPNAEGWTRVVPFFHGWLTQSSAFESPAQTGGDAAHPERTNFQNWAAQCDPAERGSYRDRFEHGYAGWPTSSAWGAGRPLTVYRGEYAVYWVYWQNRPYTEAQAWGDAAVASGCAGYLDGGTVPVR